MLYTEGLKTKLFKDKNSKKYTPASLYLGSKKTGGYSILEPSQKEIEIFNGYNDSAFVKINGESSQSGTPSPESPVNINSVENFDLITRKNNLISNGNFENGTTDFTNFGGFSLSAVDNVLTATGNTAVVAGTIGQTTSFPIILNKKIFFRCKIKAKHSFTSIETLLRGSTSGTAGTVIINTLSSPTTDTEYIVYGIGTVGASLTGDIRIAIRAYGADGTVLDKAFETKEWFAVDMGVSDSDVLYNKTADEINTMYPNWDDKEIKIINFPYTLRSLDGTADYIEIDNINKTAKLYNNVGEFSFLNDGTYVSYRYNGLLGVFSPLVLPENYTRVAGVCTHENRVGAFYSTSGTYMWIGVASKQVFWVGILDALNITTLAEFKTWLGQQTANGNTVKGIYKLITPTVTDLDYDEVTTYYPYTKIYTNATVQPTLDGKIRVQGENKSAIDLTTTDAQVSMGNDSALILRNNFTVACFIKSTIIPTSNQYFLRRYDIGINGRCWGMVRTHTRPSPQNKGLTVLVSSNGTTGNYVYGTGNIDTTDGNWHHMAFTYSDKTVKLYVDGVLDKEELVTALTSNDLFDTASVFDSAPSYNGLLDDIRYYSRVLTDDEILKLSKGLKVSDTNMVGHWKCNEGKGTTVKNETNIPNTDGTLNAQAKWTNDTFYQ